MLERCLPVKCARGELSLVAGEHAVYVFEDGLTARLSWQRARPEGYEYDLSPTEASVEFRRPGKRGEPLTLAQIEALLRALATLFPAIEREQPAWFDGVGDPRALIPRAVLSKKSLSSEDEFYRALAVEFGVGSVLVSSEERASWLTLEEIDAIVRSAFPVNAGLFEIALGTASAYGDDKVFGAVVDRGGSIAIVVQLLVYEPADGQLMIRDIKEQEVYTLPAERRGERERFDAFVQGLADGIRALFEARPNDERVAYAMPSELWDSSLLALKRAKTREDFANAYRTRKKL